MKFNPKVFLIVISEESEREPREKHHVKPKYKAIERNPQGVHKELGESQMLETKGRDRRWRKTSCFNHNYLINF